MTKLIDADALKDKRHFTKEQALKIALNTNVPFSSHDTQHVFNTAQIEEMLNLAATAAIANAPTVQREHNKYCGGKIELAYGSANCGSAFHGSIMKCDNCASEPTIQREGWVSVPIELLKDITNCFDNVPSRAHVADGVDDNLKRIAQWVNSSDGGYGLYQAVNSYLLPAAPTDTE